MDTFTVGDHAIGTIRQLIDQMAFTQGEQIFFISSFRGSQKSAASFFAPGGHSLTAIQRLPRIREKLPVLLSLSDFFENRLRWYQVPGWMAAKLGWFAAGKSDAFTDFD